MEVGTMVDQLPGFADLARHPRERPESNDAWARDKLARLVDGTDRDDIEDIRLPVQTEPCTVCGTPTTLRRCGSVLCSAHVREYDRIKNAAQSHVIATIKGDEPRTLRDRLRAKNVDRWPDRPVTRAIPTA